MPVWTHFLLPFAVGIISGSVLVFIYFRSRLRVYQYLIEQRLSAANQQIGNAHTRARERADVA